VVSHGWHRHGEQLLLLLLLLLGRLRFSSLRTFLIAFIIYGSSVVIPLPL
jgi:hypothetical protein